jgi:hypothetical protein
MFNAISRERLREIIASKFPTLEAFADLIYDGPGETFVRLEDGTWTVIAVNEGFSQGCPASPVFAAIVLNEILTQLQTELNLRAQERKLKGDFSDDKHGCIAIILAYVDDCNILLHHDDVLFFLERFVALATPLGAILNTEKTRILTTTTGSSLVDAFLNSNDPNLIARGASLKQAIATYSREQVGTALRPVEVTDGLRVLGSPIGSTSFCNSFLRKAFDKANADATKLTTSLDDLQTILRLYSTCTAHKLTHLLSCDVTNTPLEDLPRDIHLWNSELTDSFSRMTEEIICNITGTTSLPAHAHVISNISINQGGLGLNHPRLHAITSFMLSTKRSLQYSQCGVWLGHHTPPPRLPTSITTLYANWETSNLQIWQIFRQYLPRYNQICCHSPETDTDFIFKTSLNVSREKAREFTSRMTYEHILLHDDVTPRHIKPHLEGMLNREASLALMTMSRLEDANRMRNETFAICIKRKLRLKILTLASNQSCKCGARLDEYGDHCLGCTANPKTRASNNIRDGLIKVFQRILPTAQLIESPTQVECEIHNIVPSLPRLKPFDLSIRLDNSLATGAWRAPYSRIGFDVTLIHSTKPPLSSPSEAAQHTESDLRLRDGEKMKFARRTGGTNKVTKRTLSADQVIGEIIDGNNCFIPIAVGPYGDLGSLFRHFLYGENVIEIPSFGQDRPNATRAYNIAKHIRTPYDVLGRADRNWKRDHGDNLFGFTYLAPTPRKWAEQRIGLLCQSSIANHIQASFTRMSFSNSNTTTTDSPDDRSDGPEADWSFYDGNILFDDELEPELDMFTDATLIDTKIGRASQNSYDGVP